MGQKWRGWLGKASTHPEHSLVRDGQGLQAAQILEGVWPAEVGWGTKQGRGLLG